MRPSQVAELNMSPRNRAFSKPNPEGWLPKEGETVWIQSLLSATGRVRAVYTNVPRMTVVRVRVQYGWRGWSKVVPLDEIRIMDRKEWAQHATKIERDYRERKA